MPSCAFSKLIPGGNATILLPDPEFSLEQLPEVSVRLMDPMHLQAEQVGALYGPGKAPSALPGTLPHLPHLQMMGGEFCVNATRSAALLLTRQGLITPLPEAPHGAWEGEITVSGMEHPVPILAARVWVDLEAAVAGMPADTGHTQDAAENALSTSRQREAAPTDAIRLYCAARIDCAASTVRRLERGRGVTLISLPGIHHLLVDTALHSLPVMHGAAWKTASAAWRADSGLAGSPASGVVWYERLDTGYRIWPAVEVAATQSEHLETACGSASLAMTLAHYSFAGEEGQPREEAFLPSVDVFQPSGEALRVFLACAPLQRLKSAWIAGLVRLAAQGTAYF